MSKSKSIKTVKTVGGLILPTLGEEAAIQKGIEADPDTFTLEQFKKAKRGRPPMPEAEKNSKLP